jgi:hypothetical protein
MKVVSLKCVNCGASLEIGPAVDNFACGYCGTQQHVDRGGGIVSLRKIETTLSQVRQATDRTASELALVRLREELAFLRSRQAEEVNALRATDERENGFIGLALLGGSVASLYLFGWWGIALILLGLIAGWHFITPLSEKIAAIERNSAERVSVLNEQIRRHTAVVDGSDSQAR